MKSGSGVVASIAGCFAALLLVSQMWAADATLYDAKIPVYPNAVIAGRQGKLDAQALKKALEVGFGLFADTKDDPKTVVAWYRGHLPAAYALHTEAAGSQFTGDGNVINVLPYKGQTRIAIVPK